MKVGQRVQVITKQWGESQHLRIGRVSEYPIRNCSLPVEVTFAPGDTNSYNVTDLKILDGQMYFQFPKKGISNGNKGNSKNTKRRKAKAANCW